MKRWACVWSDSGYCSYGASEHVPREHFFTNLELEGGLLVLQLMMRDVEEKCQPSPVVGSLATLSTLTPPCLSYPLAPNYPCPCHVKTDVYTPSHPTKTTSLFTFFRCFNHLQHYRLKQTPQYSQNDGSYINSGDRHPWPLPTHPSPQSTMATYRQSTSPPLFPHSLRRLGTRIHLRRRGQPAGACRQ